MTSLQLHCSLHFLRPKHRLRYSPIFNHRTYHFPGKIKFRESFRIKAKPNSFRCFTQSDAKEVSLAEIEERSPFDINLAVILAGFAFESYASPPENIGKREVNAAGCNTLYLSESFVREIYDGQLFIKLKRGFEFPALDPWGTSDPYVVMDLDGQVAKSKTKWGTKEPKWNEDFVFNIKLPPAKKIELGMQTLLPHINGWGIPKSTWNVLECSATVTRNGHISMAGVTTGNVGYLANAIHEVTQGLGGSVKGWRCSCVKTKL